MSAAASLPSLPSLDVPSGKAAQLEALRNQVAAFAALRRARARSTR